MRHLLAKYPVSEYSHSIRSNRLAYTIARFLLRSPQTPHALAHLVPYKWHGHLRPQRGQVRRGLVRVIEAHGQLLCSRLSDKPAHLHILLVQFHPERPVRIELRHAPALCPPQSWASSMIQSFPQMHSWYSPGAASSVPYHSCALSCCSSVATNCSMIAAATCDAVMRCEVVCVAVLANCCNFSHVA